MASTFSCRYVDYRMVSKLALSNHFNKSAPSPGDRDKDTVALMTCQRAEAYRFGHGEDTSNIFGDLLPSSQKIEGAEAVLRRLSTISAGADSWFLGEKYIADQVSRAFRDQSHSSPLRWLGQTAKRIGDTARSESGLVALGEYSDVAINILQSKNAGPQSHILVFGGGMLGQSVARQASYNPDTKVYLVTRTPKKLKKEISGNFAICNLHHATQAISNKDFSIVIATLDVSEEYANLIRQLIRNQHCKEVVDLSSLPLFNVDDHPSYIHMYDARFSEEVLSLNAGIRHKLADTEKVIEREIKQALQHMPRMESLA